MNIFKFCVFIFLILPAFTYADFYYITGDNNDAEERISDGEMYRTSSDLEMSYDPGGSPDRGLQIIGLRFNAVNVPVGTVITDAKIRFRADEDDSGSASFVIRGELSNDAGGFNSTDYDLSSRTRTTASVNWNPGAWTNNEYYETVDISPIIQEIIDQPGYAGDDLVIFIEPGSGCVDSGCRRRADSYDASSSNAPRLELSFPGSEGFKDFALINPASTRNILGNYAIAGNTVMCLTDHTTTYGGTCQDASIQLETSNRRISKFIDIDGDDGTWNSSSSYINLPSNYDQKAGKGILWAGLFWQGRFSTDNDYPMRYGIENGSSYNLIEMGSGSSVYNDGDNINVLSLEANKIKLKVDSGSYSDATASTVYTYASSDGVTYAAFSDVTQILQDANLATGKHTFTVANLTTNEGREPSPGVFGGWSLVVIYAEDLTGDYRNISIYSGFESLGSHPDPIKISGFKLPADGDVSSQATVFSGEGEYRYGYRSGYTDNYDWMKISDTEDSGYDYMPGPTAGTHVGNRDNMFDGKLTGVLRDDITGHSNNLQVNNDGVDIDVFDVSSVMEGYRDSDPNINEIFLKVDSNNDYVTPSMIAFSTELYVPKFCYDYNVRKNGVTLSADNRDIVTAGNGELAINASIRSMEGDFDFTFSRLKVRLVPSDEVSFTQARYSPNTVNTLIPGIPTPASTSQYPEIAIGANATTMGGTIGRFERYFTEFKYNMISDTFDGHFDLDLNTTIDFGSGPVHTISSTESNTLPRCDQSNVYNPQWGMFNIERVDSGSFDPVTQPSNRFPLYTQVTGRDFEFSLVAYDSNTTPQYAQEIDVSDITVDVELIDASPYDDNGSYFKCTNTDPSIIQEIGSGNKNFFVTFPSTPTSRVDLADTKNIDIRTNTALRNAAFRMWFLVDENQTIISHNCAQTDNACFEALYAANTWESIAASQCNARCTTGTNSAANSDCYECLRTYAATPVCSRDNFSIKPASYRTVISDTNESTDITDPTKLLGKNDTTSTNTIAAGYLYKIDANATQFGTDDYARGYDRLFVTPSNDDILSQFQYQSTTGASCRDTNDTDIGVRFENGQISGTIDGNKILLKSNNLHKHGNVGDYNYHIEDNNWTIVDQERYPFKTFPDTSDCVQGDTSISVNGNEKSGCGISSELITGSPGQTYEDLRLRFEPYSFSVSDINMSLPNDKGFVYMNNDIEDLRFREMSTKFQGYISAQGKDNITVSNYTAGCAAKDVFFDINTSMTQNMQAVSINYILTEETIPQTVYFRKNYVNSSDTSSIFDNNESNVSQPITVLASEFKNEDNGSAELTLYYNFKRYANAPVNPIRVSFLSKEANSTDAASSAHLSTNYIPKGTGVVAQDVDYFYGRVISDRLDYTVPRTQTSTTANLYVEVYCDFVGTDCDIHGIPSASLRDPNEWRLNDNHTSPDDGIVDSITDPKGKLTIDPNSNIDISTNPTPIDISIPSSTPRTYSTSLDVTTETVSPWFDNSQIDTKFLGGGGWAGPGKTGLILDINASHDNLNKRTEW